jgi:hypothetical protein
LLPAQTLFFTPLFSENCSFRAKTKSPKKEK